MATGTQIEVVMPQMGVSVSEGTITKWLKQPGEAIAHDEPLLEISTDKVDTEVPSPGEGVVAADPRRRGRDGRGRDGARRDRARRRRRRRARRAGRPSPSRPSLSPSSSPSRPPPEPPAVAPAAPSHSRARPPPPAASGNGRTFVSPVVARIAAEHGVDPSVGPGHRHRRARDEEGHPRLHRVGRAGAAPPAPAGARAARHRAAAPPAPPASPRPLRSAAAGPRRSPPRLRPRRPACAAAARGARAGRSPAPGGRGRGADDRDAARRDGAHAPLARHLGARHERDRGRHVARSSRAREQLKPEYQASYGVNLTYLAFIAQGDRGDAAGLPVGQRRDPRRDDRHAPLRQPRHRRRARRTARG